jgi:hypothetical protein
MLNKKTLAFAAIALVALLVSSCLKCEKKTYTWNFTGANSGTLTVTWTNIMSEVDYDSEDSTPEDQKNSDYNDLISRFIDGTEAENEFPNAKFVSKRLFEKDGVLCGEAVFEFTDISQVKIYKYDKAAPMMFYTTDTIMFSNGTKGPAYMPVVIWENNQKAPWVTTSISATEGESLLAIWKSEKLEKPMGGK